MSSKSLEDSRLTDRPDPGESETHLALERRCGYARRPDGPSTASAARRAAWPDTQLRRSNQRDRIVESVIEVVSETGYAGLTVRAVVERAGVSRRTFYEHFSNKEDVFLAVYDVVVERLAGDVRLAYAGGRTYPQQVALGLEMFLGRLAAYPALAHVCIVQVLAAGPQALARRAHALQTFCDLIRPAGERLAAGPAAGGRGRGRRDLRDRRPARQPRRGARAAEPVPGAARGHADPVRGAARPRSRRRGRRASACQWTLKKRPSL